MIKIRRSKERGHANYGWLDTNYTFSFSNYYDPRFMGFRSLRVINEDFIAPDQGFPTHGHADMEILTYVIRGELSHKDSMGNGTTILPNEVQRMTAGTGVLHSEYSSPSEETHLLQIWILPEEENLTPGYEQTFFAPEDKKGKLKLVASRGGDDGSVTIHQDVNLYSSLLATGETVEHSLAENRHAWIQIVKGSIELNGETLNQGDGAAVSDETSLKIKSLSDETEFLLFDLS
ncbi:MAG TPA: pirin family protein [Pyrinomonadaceae bacterium]|jgi:redox-sensitive bicupin YhaK (pirin superfamily)|nr:pirin family protein [Pyrinomonadaceae bacterium]